MAKAVEIMSSYKICIFDKRAWIVAKATGKRRVTVLFHLECAQKKFNNLLTDCKGERGSPKPIVTAAI